MNLKTTFLVVVSLVALNQNLAAPFFGPGMMSLEAPSLAAQILAKSNADNTTLQKVAEDGDVCEAVGKGSKPKIQSGHQFQAFLAGMVRHSAPFGFKKF
jgi:hypothetical protein